MREPAHYPSTADVRPLDGVRPATVTIMSGLEVEGDTAGARDAASEGPVFITGRGEPAHVLLRMADDRRLSGRGPDVADMLAMPEEVEIELEILPRIERPRRVVSF